MASHQMSPPLSSRKLKRSDSPICLRGLDLSRRTKAGGRGSLPLAKNGRLPLSFRAGLLETFYFFGAALGTRL